MQFTTILRKDIRSEMRTRQSASAVFLFAFNAIFVSVIALGGLRVAPEIMSALFWLILLFSSSLASAKSFVSEEDRGTSMYLRFIAAPSQVLAGKLLYNIILLLALSLFTMALETLIFDVIHAESSGWFIVCGIMGAVCIACVMTLCAAMIARSSSKGSLLPVIAFPLLLPVVFVGIDATTMSMAGTPGSYIAPQLGVMMGYTTVLMLASFVVFPFVWRD